MLQRLFNLGGNFSTAYGVYSWLGAGGVGTFMLVASQFLDTYPKLSGFLLAVGTVAILAAVFFAYIYAFEPPTGCYSARSLRWYGYRLPWRKVCWGFDNYLSLHSKEHETRAQCFQPRLHVLRGTISPKAAYIECRHTGGNRQDVKIECGNPYVFANEIEEIPARPNPYSAQAFFRDEKGDEGIPVREFLRTYDGFDFVFEYDDKTFRKSFSRWDLDRIVERYERANNPRPSPQPIAKVRT